MYRNTVVTVVSLATTENGSKIIFFFCIARAQRTRCAPYCGSILRDLDLTPEQLDYSTAAIKLPDGMGGSCHSSPLRAVTASTASAPSPLAWHPSLDTANPRHHAQIECQKLPTLSHRLCVCVCVCVYVCVCDLYF